MRIIGLAFLLFTTLYGSTQSAYWSNNGFVSIKNGAYLSVQGDCYNQGSGSYNKAGFICTQLISGLEATVKLTFIILFLRTRE
jgi:hypothetical protein